MAYQSNSNFQSWQVKKMADREERERLAYLNQPLPKNDAALFTSTRVRVLRPFFVDGRPVDVGAVITLPRHDAVSLSAIKKVEML